MAINTALFGEHLLFMEALAAALRSVRDFDVVGSFTSQAELITALPLVQPAVLVIDVDDIRGDFAPIASRVQASHPDWRITITASSPTRGLVDRAVKTGILGVVPKRAQLDYLVGAIRGVAAGCLVIDPRLMQVPEQAPHTLSDRETEVLRMTASGAPVKEIAQTLFLAEGTVRNLTSTAMKKLRARNRFDAARIARELSLI
ncbi:response regulator transcription factor [Streptomyces afghaniensis]|uniref:response regulator transcription factor n=1 Tax=Streptomyces afghaniensis TaxID=66865 RepID=UPI0033A4060A